MAHLHLVAGWVGMLAGVLSGMVLGLGFHQEGWQGGYASWRRRLLRLGHIACFGIGGLNLAFAWTAPALAPGHAARAASALLLVALAAMPAVCWLAAWRPGLRAWFPVPVLGAAGGIAATLAALAGAP